MAMKPYSDVSLDISVLGCLGKVKKELDPEDGHLSLGRDDEAPSGPAGGAGGARRLAAPRPTSARCPTPLTGTSTTWGALLASVLGSSRRRPTTRTSSCSLQSLRSRQRPSLHTAFGASLLCSFYLHVQSFCQETKTSSCPLRPAGAAPGSWGAVCGHVGCTRVWGVCGQPCAPWGGRHL
ncbi:PREDICTED: uncharacterized protein LOC108635005 [Capra hircus]|uniref:uncharacterized protein LOC108635005 n=1 Tax=Capra hircus TaxID=9925 RepID=UPI00084748F6|nr:PREDICTED: uncharacterized protein LOC108635005 [Capra hircus]